MSRSGVASDDEGITHKMMPRSISDSEGFRNADNGTSRSPSKRQEEGETSPSHSTSCCTWLFVVRLLDTVLLLILSITQGSLLNYLIIYHRQKSHTVYLWFLADFAVVMAFVGALITSYQKVARRLRLALKSIVPTGTEIPIYGSLPLSYLSWFLYSIVLVAKIIVIFKREIANELGDDDLFDSQTLKLVIGAGASIVFLLLVNAHQSPSHPNNDHRAYVAALCTGTAFEIFDAVAFLELLFVNDTRVLLPYPFENTILALASINLILPTVPLLRLSRAEYGQRDRPAVLGLIYSTLKLLVIEVPYLCIRAYVWNVYDTSSSSIFMLKNILMIVVKLRYIIPEYAHLIVLQRQAKKNKELFLSNSSGTLEMKSIS
ncbi:hypothetical protein CHUAL_000287 [Chamberlinius hualienensis]